MKKLLFTLVLILLPDYSLAQGYVRLNALSPFYCNYLPGGKTQIATKSKTGKYTKISFDKARDQSGDRKAELRNKQKKLNNIRKDLIKEISKNEYAPRPLTEKEKKLILDLADGSTETVTPGTPLDDAGSGVRRLEEISHNLQTALEFQNLERNQIKDCEKKVLPPLSDLTIIYDLLIAQDLRTNDDSWVGLGIAYIKLDKILVTAGENANAVCLTFANGTKRYVGFSSDPMSGVDTHLAYGTDHALVIYGETARLLQRNEQNQVTEYGYVITDFSQGTSSSKRENIENRYKSALPAKIAEYGTSVKAERPDYNKRTKTYVCP